MSQSPQPPPRSPSTDDLQFHTAEPMSGQPMVAPQACSGCGEALPENARFCRRCGIAIAPAPLAAAVAAPAVLRPSGPTTQVCIVCNQPVTSQYYAAGDKVVCPSCHGQILARTGGDPALKFIKAAVLGLGAGLVGALIWYLIRYYGHMQIGLVAVLVGFMVGKAVRKGSGNVGGRQYQILALVLTYGCIAANWLPDNLDLYTQTYEIESIHNMTTAQWADLLTITMETPFLDRKKNVIDPNTRVLDASQNALGLLIISFALFEAWKFTAHRRLFTGPYQIGSGPGVAVRPPMAPGTRPGGMA